MDGILRWDCGVWVTFSQCNGLRRQLWWDNLIGGNGEALATIW
jgi:hypothetical protein